MSKVLKGHNEIVSTFVWGNSRVDSSDLLISGSLDRTIRVWKGDQSLHILKDHADWIRCLALSHNQQHLLSGCVNATIMAWDMHTLKPILKIKQDPLRSNDSLGNSGGIGNHNGGGSAGGDHNGGDQEELLNTVNSVYFMNESDCVFASGARDGIVRVYDLRTASHVPQMSFLAHVKPNQNTFAKINDAYFTCNDQFIISSGRDSTIRQWDLRRIHNTRTFSPESVYCEFKGHKCTNYNINSMIIGPSHRSDQYLVTGSEDKFIYMYDMHTGDIVQKLQGHPSVVHLVHGCTGGSGTNANDPLMFVSSCIQDNCLFQWGISHVNGNCEEREQERLQYEKQNTAMMSQLDATEFDLQRALTEVIMERYGDRIIQLFHQNNYAFSGIGGGGIGGGGGDTLLINIETTSDSQTTIGDLSQQQSEEVSVQEQLIRALRGEDQSSRVIFPQFQPNQQENEHVSMQLLTQMLEQMAMQQAETIIDHQQRQQQATLPAAVIAMTQRYPQQTPVAQQEEQEDVSDWLDHVEDEDEMNDVD